MTEQQQNNLKGTNGDKGDWMQGGFIPSEPKQQAPNTILPAIVTFIIVAALVIAILFALSN